MPKIPRGRRPIIRREQSVMATLWAVLAVIGIAGGAAFGVIQLLSRCAS